MEHTRGIDKFARLDDSVFLITGGEGGLGQAFVKTLLSAGATVVTGDLIAPNSPSPDDVAQARYLNLPLDVTDESSVEEALTEIHRRYGRLDGLVNNAGIMFEVETADNAAWPAWERTIEVNLSGTYRVTRAAQPFLATADAPAVVSITSQMAFAPGSQLAAYAASKAGIVGMTRALARELGPGIRCNAIAPGPIITPMTAGFDDEQRALKTRHLIQGRFGEAEEVAPAVRFLLSRESSFITGQTLNINGGGYLS